MSDELVKLTVDGQELEAPKGEMLMRVTDEAGIYIPRFCYHKHLRVVANCRQCLVEIEGAPKPMPACAQPISDGMVVYTRSEKAVDAQRATMEFELINHPLDCPVCDQGGECELQDLAWGYGRGVSRFTERKRVVRDKSIGPLVHTAMTRCIYCTRCIRVLEEVGGRYEMGATGRGENMRITTWIERSIDSELSGNIIDVCPVGALEDKPFNARARGWEMLAQRTVSPQDCVGSNMYGHTLRGKFLRAVPRENEDINDSWISDRDRWAYKGAQTADRLRRPMLRRDGEWHEVGWSEALAAAAQILGEAGAGLASLVSPTATLEEMYLAQKLTHELGSKNVDVRLRQADFRDDAGDPRFPSLGGAIADLNHTETVLLLGARINKEAPILGYRLRRAVGNGGSVAAINPRSYEMNIPLSEESVVHPDAFCDELAALAIELAKQTRAKLPAFMNAFETSPAESTAAIAKRLAGEGETRMLLGAFAMYHPRFADVRRLAALVAELAGGTLGYLSDGGNTAGAYLAGAVPHRGPGGVPVEAGLDARAMLAAPQAAYLLFGVEPERDARAGEAALAALRESDVVAATSFLSPTMREYADCVLPLAAFGETAGSSINGAGRLQEFDAVAATPWEVRPGWKILRALGAELAGEEAFGATSIGDVREELTDSIGYTGRVAPQVYAGSWEPAPARDRRPELRAVGEVGLYAVNALVRRARPLQETSDAEDSGKLWLNPEDAAARGLAGGDRVRLSAESGEREFVLACERGVLPGTAWFPATCGLAPWESATLEAVTEAAGA